MTENTTDSVARQDEIIQVVGEACFWEFIKLLGFFPNFRCLVLNEKVKAKLNGTAGPLSIQKRHGTEQERYLKLKQANEAGRDIFWVPPDCGENGQERLVDIKFIRTVTLDLDDVSYGPVLEFGIKPNLIVETSPGSYHCTWVLEPYKATPENLKEYHTFVDKFRKIFGGDDCCDAAHIFRTPGFKHLKGEPYESRIVFRGHNDSGGRSITFSNLQRAYTQFNYGERRKTERGSEVSGGISQDSFDNNQRRGSKAVQLSSIDECYGAEPSEFQGNSKITNRIHEADMHQPSTSFPARGSQNIRGNTQLHKENGNDINLNNLIAGKIRVPEGSRHLTIFRLYIKLLEAGKEQQIVWHEVDELISKYFDKPLDYRQGGKNYSDTLKLRRDATEKYIPANKAERDAKAVAALRKSEDFEKSNGFFEYDFDHGTLKHNKYSERGYGERVLQRFGYDLAKVDRRVYCFNQQQKVWHPQNLTAGEFPELEARVVAVINDVIQERDFEKRFRKENGDINERAKDLKEESLLKWSSTSAVSKIVMNMAGLPQYKWADFDADPDLFYFKNRVVNMRTLEVREARNEDRLLCQSAVEWKGFDVKCPGWDRFLAEIFAEADEPQAMINFMWSLYGYTMGGSIAAQRIFCHSGGGGNGKSKNLDCLKMLLGSYAHPLGGSDLISKEGNFTQLFERLGAKVEGKRGGMVDDIALGAWNSDFLKALTGKEFEARGVYEKHRIITNRCKFHIALNKKPDIDQEDESIIRRLCFIPYLSNFDNSEQESIRIDNCMEQEISAIAAKAVMAYHKDKMDGTTMTFPKQCLEEALEYRLDQFKGEALVKEHLEETKELENDDSWMTSSEIVEALNRVSTVSAIKVTVSPESIGRMMLKAFGVKGEKRYNKRTHKTQRMYSVGLKKEQPEGLKS